MNTQAPVVTIVELETAGFLTVADDLAGALQDGEKMSALLARVAEQARALAPDVSTAKGRDAIKSNAFKVVRSRTAVHQAGLDLTEEWRRKTGEVNKRREAAKAELDALEAEVRKPLTDWETAEAERKAKLADLLQSLRPLADRDSTSAEIAAERERIAAIVIDETWQEAAAAGRERQRDAIANLDRDRKFASDREEQQAEIRRMAAELAAQKAAAAKAAEEAEKERQRTEALRKRLDELRPPSTDDWTSLQIEAEIERLEVSEIGSDWQEVAAEAAALRRETVVYLTGRLVKVREREARDREQAEAVKAAEEKAAAAEAAARAAQEAKEAAERAQREADERAAAAEAEKAAAVEAERRRIAEEEERKVQYEADREREAEIVAAARRRLIDALASLLPIEDVPDGEVSYAEIIAREAIAGRLPHLTFEPLA